jgi:hypothetical protein
MGQSFKFSKPPMQVTSQPSEWRVVVHLDNDAEEASYVYDLIHSGRLQMENKETLPLPFRGAFLIKLPERARPLAVQVGRLESTATEKLSGEHGLKLLVSCDKGSEELLAELERALREIPPASDSDVKSDESDHQDQYTRIRNMTFPQKVIYATRAGQGGRAILMQQPTPMLLLYICKNPLITLTEIVQIAKLPSIDALVAEYIVKMIRSNPQWATSEDLKLAIATNIKTPGGTALSLLGHLSSRSLRQICKRGEVSGTLKNGALKILMERKD